MIDRDREFAVELFGEDGSHWGIFLSDNLNAILGMLMMAANPNAQLGDFKIYHNDNELKLEDIVEIYEERAPEIPIRKILKQFSPVTDQWCEDLDQMVDVAPALIDEDDAEDES